MAKFVETIEVERFKGLSIASETVNLSKEYKKMRNNSCYGSRWRFAPQLRRSGQA